MRLPMIISGLILGSLSVNAQNDPAQNTSDPAEPQPIVRGCTEAIGHHVRLRQIACPIGGKNAEAFILGSHSTYGQYLDMTDISYLRFPVALSVCPSNGMAGAQYDYTEEEKTAIAAVLESADYKDLLNGQHTSWHLFARQMDLAGLHRDELWWYYSRAAAEAETCEFTDILPDYLKQAQAMAMARLKTMTPDDEAYWMVMLASINYDRKLGNFETASQRLSELENSIPKNMRTPFSRLKDAIDEKSTERVSAYPKKR